ncbi:hypothetical protein AAFF_G00418110 [Aldrovandia affinis]|uniref:Uncharacterized protein n=1 Tax=Aldrovandia affinis TaxID=143900 RepID=A0AAD7SAL9_9TELE|nr:hypothetical protein AAFF_G00418110 [Aldrovandia affinis]
MADLPKRLSGRRSAVTGVTPAALPLRLAVVAAPRRGLSGTAPRSHRHGNPATFVGEVTPRRQSNLSLHRGGFTVAESAKDVAAPGFGEMWQFGKRGGLDRVTSPRSLRPTC